MQVSIETTSGLERCMTIGVPAAELEEKVTSELKRIAKGQRVNGFRKNKPLPPSVAKRMFGKQARLEAVYQQMQQSFFQAVQEQDVKLAGMPRFEPTLDEDGKDLEFKATFEVYPEIALADFSKIAVERKSAEVKDEDLETMVETLRKQKAQWQDSGAAAQDGDQVNIDFEGFIDGEAFEGGKVEGYDLTLGSKSMIPGFEESLVGVEAGAETTIEVTFPEDYQKEDLQGKAAQFKIKVNAVKAPELPELNEAFFNEFGVETADEAEFRTEIRKNMVRELDRAIRTLNKQQVIKGLLDSNDIDVPSSLIDQEIDRLRQQAVQQFGGAQQFDPKQLPAELFKEQAEKRVRIGLLMNAAIEAENIEPSAEKVEQLIEEVAATYQEPEQVREYYNNNPEQKSQVEALALEEQVVEKVLAVAQVSDVESSYEEVIRAANQPA
ncbi:trigger factor [Bacterioplanes sanyensis]|uniref:trigger factor n=1 Tax=Bacterioplanes sanyensis TaxID=1249553 RepID=UPI001672FD21|nr:trigger factor [Bacterioplanes sanyensis]GGY40847.1 trigger factor [Bacterioplanes sanyensis]